MMPNFREKLSVEETSPYPGVVQPWSVTKDEDQNGITKCIKHLDRCVGAVPRVLQSLTAVVSRCRVFRCCGRCEAVDRDVKLSVEETSPSQVSVQPRGIVDGEMLFRHIHPNQPIPVCPRSDTQADSSQRMQCSHCLKEEQTK